MEANYFLPTHHSFPSRRNIPPAPMSLPPFANTGLNARKSNLRRTTGPIPSKLCLAHLPDKHRAVSPNICGSGGARGGRTTFCWGEQKKPKEQTNTNTLHRISDAKSTATSRTLKTTHRTHARKKNPIQKQLNGINCDSLSRQRNRYCVPEIVGRFRLVKPSPPLPEI